MLKAIKKSLYALYTNLPWKTHINPASVGYTEAFAFFKKRDKYYTELLDAIAPLIDKNGAILDIGANIGYFTLTLYERYGFTGKAHLFEPVSHLNSLCNETFKGKGFDVTIHPFALGSENTTTKIFLAADGNIGWNTIVAGKAGKRMQEEVIEIKKFDDLDIPLPGFIKIDVEGAEWMVLNGMMGKLASASKLPVILCELGWGNKHPQFDQVLKTFSSLSSIGYRTFDLDHNPVDISSLTETTDLLLLEK
ncbi:MAG: FkbM family methyltransferase [bacterium]